MGKSNTNKAAAENGSDSNTNKPSVKRKKLTLIEKRQKAEKQTKVALKKEQQRNKEESQLKDIAKKEGYGYRPPAFKVSNWKDVKENAVYTFVPQHGRYKHEGELYEPGESFVTAATYQHIEHVKEGILFVTELGEFNPRAEAEKSLV